MTPVSRNAHLSKTAKGAAASGGVVPALKPKVGQPPILFWRGTRCASLTEGTDEKRGFAVL